MNTFRTPDFRANLYNQGDEMIITLGYRVKNCTLSLKIDGLACGHEPVGSKTGMCETARGMKERAKVPLSSLRNSGKVGTTQFVTSFQLT